MRDNHARRGAVWLLALGGAVAWMAVEAAQAVPLKVACVQMQLSSSMANNASNIVAHLASEAAQGTRVVVFSEFALTGYDPAAAPHYQQPAIESAVAEVVAACATHNLYAIAGTPWHEGSVR